MIFNERELRQVAKVVVKYNDRCHSSEDAVYKYMKELAAHELQNGYGYVSTLGFVLTAYSDPGGSSEIHIKASVESTLFPV